MHKLIKIINYTKNNPKNYIIKKANMVKNSLKLEKINKEAEALVTTKAKKKQAKLKIIKSKI